MGFHNVRPSSSSMYSSQVLCALKSASTTALGRNVLNYLLKCYRLQIIARISLIHHHSLFLSLFLYLARQIRDYTLSESEFAHLKFLSSAHSTELNSGNIPREIEPQFKLGHGTMIYFRQHTLTKANYYYVFTIDQTGSSVPLYLYLQASPAVSTRGALHISRVAYCMQIGFLDNLTITLIMICVFSHHTLVKQQLTRLIPTPLTTKAPPVENMGMARAMAHCHM